MGFTLPVSHNLPALLFDFSYTPPFSPGCTHTQETAIPLCQELKLPTALAKSEGPIYPHCLPVIKMNWFALQQYLPKGKLSHIEYTLRQWEGHHSASSGDVVIMQEDFQNNRQHYRWRTTHG